MEIAAIVCTPPFLIGGDESFQKSKGWGGSKFFAEIGGEVKIGGDSLRLGGMALYEPNLVLC